MINRLCRLAALSVITSAGIASSLFASQGVVNELTLPSGVSVQNATAVTESWTLATSTNEILVYSNVSGKLVRRLRPPHAAGIIFGKYIAAAGDFVVVSDASWSLCAFNCATGKHLWDAVMPQHGLVKALATDGKRVAAGEPEASSPTSGFLFEGVVSILDAGTGQVLANDKSTWGQANALYGDAVAVSGPWLAVGSPAYDVSGLTNNGAVVVKNLSGTENIIFAPDASSGAGFGRSVAISGNTLYVGTLMRDRVYLFDIGTLAFVKVIDEPVASITSFGKHLAASGHLLLISSEFGAWLYDRQNDFLGTLFPGTGGATPVQAGASLCGGYAAAPTAGKLYRAKYVGSTLGGSEVMASGEVLTGPGVVKAGTFGSASLNPSGVATFSVRQVGSGVTSATDSAIWQGWAGSKVRTMREGTLYGSAKGGSGSNPFFSDDSGSSFWLNRSSTSAVSLWRHTAGSTALLFGPGSNIAIAGYPNLVLSKIYAAGTVQSNGNALNLSLKLGGSVVASNDSIIIRSNTVSSAEAREGGATGLMGALHAQINPRLATAGNRIAFSSFLTGRPTDKNAAAFTKVLGGNSVAAMEKGDVPVGVSAQFPDAVMTSFIGEAVSGGATVVRGTYKTAKFSAEALMSYNHGTGADHCVAWVRGQVPGLPTGVTWKRFLKVFVAENGDTFFLAQIGGTGVTLSSDLGFWHCALGSTTPKLLMREGTIVAGTSPAKIGTIQQVDAHRDGTWTLLASLTGCPSSWNQVLVGGNIASDLSYEVIARKGIVVDRPTPSTLLGLALPTGNTSTTGMASAGTCRFAVDGKVLHHLQRRHRPHRLWYLGILMAPKAQIFLAEIHMGCMH